MIFIIFRLIYYIYKADYIFFFPRMGIGGADKMQVHLCSAIKGNVLVLFDNSISKENILEKQLKRKIFKIHLKLYLKKNKNLIAKIIVNMIKLKKRVKLFGSNSTFFYDIMPYLPKNVFCADRVPALGGGIEFYSEKIKNRLQARFFSYEKMKNNKTLITQNYYQKHIVMYAQTAWKTQRKKCPPHTIDRKFKIIYVGRDSKEKRLHLLVALARKIYETSLPFEFEFIGDITSIPLSNHYKIIPAISNENELKQKVQEADIILLLSEREGIPISLIEASTQGVVPLCTDVGGISEKFIHNHNAFLIPNNQNEDNILENAFEILQKIAQQPGILTSMSDAVIELAENEFTDIDGMKEIFRSVFDLANEKYFLTTS